MKIRDIIPRIKQKLTARKLRKKQIRELNKLKNSEERIRALQNKKDNIAKVRKIEQVIKIQENQKRDSNPSQRRYLQERIDHGKELIREHERDIEVDNKYFKLSRKQAKSKAFKN